MLCFNKCTSTIRKNTIGTIAVTTTVLDQPPLASQRKRTAAWCAPHRLDCARNEKHDSNTATPQTVQICFPTVHGTHDFSLVNKRLAALAEGLA